MPNAKPKKGVPPGGVPTEIAGLFLSSLSLLGFLAAEGPFRANASPTPTPTAPTPSVKPNRRPVALLS